MYVMQPLAIHGCTCNLQICSLHLKLSRFTCSSTESGCCFHPTFSRGFGFSCANRFSLSYSCFWYRVNVLRKLHAITKLMSYRITFRI